MPRRVEREQNGENDISWIWPPPCNRNPLLNISKHVIILVVTIAGRGPYQRYKQYKPEVTFQVFFFGGERVTGSFGIKVAMRIF